MDGKKSIQFNIILLMLFLGTTSRQDGEQFEECLRRCNALERKLTQQVVDNLDVKFQV